MISCGFGLAREYIYRYYEQIAEGLRGNRVPDKIKDYLRRVGRDNSFVFWSGRIINEEISGEDFFLGRVLDKKVLLAEDKEISLIVASPEYHEFKGIDLFEQYVGTYKRVLMRSPKRVIVRARSLDDLDNPRTKEQIRYLFEREREL